MTTHKEKAKNSPYQSGQKINIQAHIPPPPYGADYKNKNSIRKPVGDLLDRFEQPTVDHLSYVLANPPLATAPPAAPTSHVLTIVDKISHSPKEKKRGGAYLVSCYLDSNESQLYVAKIYDGFEYRLISGREDCMYRADMDYGREAAAYENMPQRFQGDTVPRYHGSWTFSLPVNPNNEGGTSIQQRPVRMILIEYIQGESMLQSILRAIPDKNPCEAQFNVGSVNYSLLPPEKKRLDVPARILEAETALWWYAGIEQNDLSPRNIMITRDAKGGSFDRVVLIDFNMSYVLKLSESGRRALSRRTPGSLPASPINRYWPGGIYACGGSFNGWIPESWCVDYDTSADRALEWLVSRWNGSPNYRPVVPGISFIITEYTSDVERHWIETFTAQALADEEKKKRSVQGG